ncbi:MAG: DUF5659 domain-containing protein [Patescibacteria group bacterium]|nr:DUF5659 domain-containing protein [Patescibacteria group bacterium]MCL5432226.1 DUF5659 domain-containing protein [Patescibacteria group bacterium]
MDKNSYGNEHFATSNFYCAIFLYVKGLRLVDIDRAIPQRSQFVFLDTLERKSLVQSFNFAEKNSPEVMVDAREFEMATKTLKDKLYQISNDKT